jgi:hypothetical protein
MVHPFPEGYVMPKMISKVAHIYAGRNLSPGDPFEADQEFVGTLVALGRAEIEPMRGGTTEYETRDMAAAAPAEYGRRDLSAATTPRQKRKYNKKRQAA